MDAIRAERSEALLKAPLLAMQQAGLHQVQVLYQLLQLYVSTLATGIQRLSENSKVPLLDKLTSLAGMDT